MDADFDPYLISLLDRGFVYAIAHVRGGQEMGRAWYEDGKLFKKMNTFSDFIDCGDYLVKEGYTRPERLFAEGGSAPPVDYMKAARALGELHADAVAACMREAGVRLLIHGHTHRPAVHAFDLDGRTARRIVLGDWYEQGSLLRCDGEGCRLEILPLQAGG